MLLAYKIKCWKGNILFTGSFYILVPKLYLYLFVLLTSLIRIYVSLVRTGHVQWTHVWCVPHVPWLTKSAVWKGKYFPRLRSQSQMITSSSVNNWLVSSLALIWLYGDKTCRSHIVILANGLNCHWLLRTRRGSNWWLQVRWLILRFCFIQWNKWKRRRHKCLSLGRIVSNWRTGNSKNRTLYGSCYWGKLDFKKIYIILKYL